jgi:hypothetical protein
MIPHYIWPTGGKGIHFSVFLDVHGYQREVGWREIRQAVYDRICREANVRSDASRVYWSDETQGALLRAEGGLRHRFPPDLLAWADERNGMVTSYKYWVERPSWTQRVVTKPWEVFYPQRIRTWSPPQEWLPRPGEHNRERTRPSAGSSLPELIAKLIVACQRGHDLSDFGRFAIAAHMSVRGYDVEEIVNVFRGCPDFNEATSRRRIAGVARGKALPGPRSILDHCENEMREWGLL